MSEISLAGFRLPGQDQWNNLYGWGQNTATPDLLGTGMYGASDVLSPVTMAAPISKSIATTVNPMSAMPAQTSWLDGMLGKTLPDGTKVPGWGGLALGTLQGLGSAFLGMKQYGIAKQTLAENKRQFGLNYEAQKTTTNAQLEDRQRARVASNPGAYQSVGDYMNKYGIK